MTGLLALLAAAALALSPREELCATANPNDQLPDDAALQACLERGGRVALAAGSPGYLVARGLVLRKSGTELTSADPLRPARVLAHPDLFAIMLDVPDGTTGYRLHHVSFDGNLARRRRANDCRGHRSFGTNVRFRGSRFKIEDVESTGAMCGSALEGQGADFEIARCRVHDNGRSAGGAREGLEPWADGITLWRCDQGWVHDNTLTDNTDVGLVIGGGNGCRVERNTVEQRRAYAFAGLMVGHFPGADGRHRDSVYSGNSVESELDKLAFGLMVGAHPWNPKLLLPDVGSVVENRVRGAVVGLAIDGIGGGRVVGNRVTESRGTRGMGGCRKSANYTAAHFGRATIEPDPVYRSYHEGECQDLKRPNGAVFMRQRVPRRLKPGQAARAELTFRNSGHDAWTAADGFALGSQAPSDNRTFRSGRVRLSPGTRIEPGETLTWEFPIQAPARRGSYAFQWRMVRERVEWFGHPSKHVEISVRP